MKATAKSDLEPGRGRGAAFALMMLSVGVGFCLRDRICCDLWQRRDNEIIQ
jgi:hypothetical protein